jgi:prophage tail gpP-like protein
MAFNPDEVCEIIVNGQIFRDWKSVLVNKVWMAPYDYARFTTSEGYTWEDKPVPESWDVLRLRPGDYASVILGGEEALSGYITTRQAAYAASHHIVELTVKTNTWQLAKGQATSPTMELRDKTFVEAAQEIVKPFGITYEHRGPPPTNKHERINLVGKTAWQVLEELSRSDGVVLGATPKGPGDVLVGTPENWIEGGTDAAIEGKNILEGREILSIEANPGPASVDTQNEPKAGRHGAQSTHMPANTGGLAEYAKSFGFKGVHMPLGIRMEVPGSASSAQGRGAFERYASGVESVILDIVVQGWKRPSGALWQKGQLVYVDSPMLIIKEGIWCKSVTFTQDDRSGTRTALNLVRNLGKGPSSG